MSSLFEQLSRLSPAQRSLLEAKWKERSSKRIDQVDEQQLYVLSPNQQRLWLHQTSQPQDCSYHMTLAVELEGTLATDVLENCFHQVVARHEILRTNFVIKEGQVFQSVIHHGVINMESTDLSSFTDELQFVEVRRHIEADNTIPFSLDKDPLIRVKLYQLGAEHHILSIIMHHIISDGWSTALLLQELIALYSAQVQCLDAVLPQLVIQYRQYAEQQQQWLLGNEYSNELCYWMDNLRTAPACMQLPLDFVRPVKPTYEGAVRSFSINGELLEGLKRVSRTQGTTLFTTLYAAFTWLLRQYTAENQIVIGVPVAGRQQYETESLIGFFVNTLILCTDVSGNPTFSELLQRAGQTCIAAYDHPNVPYDKLIHELLADQPVGYLPYSNVMFNYQSKSVKQVEIGPLRIQPFILEGRTSKADLTLECIEDDVALQCGLEYRTDLFEDSTIQRLEQHFIFLLTTITLDPDMYCEQLPIPEEDYNLLKQWNETEAPYNLNRNIYELFVDQASQTPDARAFVYDDHQLTYRDLEEQSSYWADILRQYGVTKGSMIGIYMERSFEFMIAALAVLKLGAIFVPLDVNYPAKRVKFMLDDSGVALILSLTRYGEQLPAYTQPLIFLDNSVSITPTSMDTPLSAPFYGSDAAYMLYTSGSTGTPKGVIGTHGNVLNRLQWMWGKFPFKSGEVCCFKTSTNFIDSIWEMFGPLLRGVPSVIISESEVRDIRRFLRLLKEHEVTRLVVVPSLLQLLLDTGVTIQSELPTLRYFIVSGEELSSHLVRQFRLSTTVQTKLINLYGSSEVTADATWYDTAALEEGVQRVPIGKPIDNTFIYILNEQLRQVPIGVVGELYIGGSGVAQGYYRRPEMNEERFICDPFHPESDLKLFRTGDLGRYLKDGNIEYLGRMDSQVKINGVRIEINEIESNVLKCERIREAAVTLDDAGKTLCVHYSGEIRPSALKLWLKERLPRHMIPASFVVHERLPRLPNGKLDRKQLLDCAETPTLVQEEAPSNSIESKLVEIWKSLFQRETIGTNVDFYEYGGHSLKAALLTFRIYEFFHVQIPLTRVMEGCTIQELALWIQEAERSSMPPINKIGEMEEYPASSAQARLYVVHQLGKGDTAYNLPGVMQIKGHVNPERLESSLQKLIERHDILRTSVHFVDARIIQRIQAKIAWKLPIIQKHEEEVEKQIELFIQPFDISRAPLFRALLIQHAKDHYTLLIDLHHIIVDGTSVQLLLEEWMQLYSGAELSTPDLQYTDYAYWQQQQLHSPEMEAQRSYWHRIFQDGAPVLQLPTDHPRIQSGRRSGKHYSFQLSFDQTEELRQFGLMHDSSLFILTLAAFGVLLSRLSGQDDIVVGSVVSGRQHPALLHMPGVFINNLALRLKPENGLTFIDFLRRVRNTVFGALEHQDYPYEELAATLKLEREKNRGPLFDVMMNWHNYESAALSEDEGLSLFALSPPSTGAKYDMTLNAWESEGVIHFQMEYDSTLFKEETIDRWSQYMLHIIQTLMRHSELPLSRIPVIHDEAADEMIGRYHQNGLKSTDHSFESIISLFLTRVSQVPMHTAVIDQGRSYTYRDLDEDSKKLENAISAAGKGSLGIVGIMMDRSYDMVVALLSVLRSGRAFLPIDPSYPIERIKYMLNESHARILIANKQPEEIDFDGVCLDVSSIQSSHECSVVFEGHEVTEQTIQEEDLAYVIFTSGSTGRPKGVMISHGSLANYAQGMSESAGINASSVVLALTTVSFDIFITEILLPLSIGATIVMAKEAHQRDGERLSRLMQLYRPNVLQATPSRIQLMLKQADCPFFEHVQLLIVGGEPFPSSLLSQLRNQYSGRLINAYGPTEATVWASFKELNSMDRKVTIGRPLPGYRMYVLNEGGQIQPAGVVGELYISGSGVASGYLHQPELTAERFMQDPFILGQRMYKTGDRARWLENGEIELFGRADEQLKLRGYRIEPGEIEHWLLQYPEIYRAVVMLRGEGEKAGLYAYYEGVEGIEEGKLRKHLLNQIPDYMVPQYFIRLESMPLTSNHKLDRNALPSSHQRSCVGPDSDHKPEQPRTSTQEAIAQIWADILQVEGVRLEDTFFDQGGNSILLMLVHERMNRMYPDLLDITDIFAYPTIMHISEKLDMSLNRAASIQLQPVMLPEAYCQSGSANAPNGKLSLQLSKEMLTSLRLHVQKADCTLEELLLAAYIYALMEWSGQYEFMVGCNLSAEEAIRFISIDSKQLQIDSIDEWVMHIAELYRSASQHSGGELAHALQLRSAGLNESIPLFLQSYHSLHTEPIRRQCGVLVTFEFEEHWLRTDFEYEGALLRKQAVQELAELYDDVLGHIQESTVREESGEHE